MAPALLASALAAPMVIVAVQLVFFGMPLGLWMRGGVLGMLTALLAVGLALVYRANRVVNFAQADLGSAPVAFAVGLVVFWGWSYWLGLGIGLVGSLVLGAVVEVALVRRFRNASRLVLTVATIGIAALLVVLAIITPRLWGRNAASERIAAPFDWTFEVGSVVLSANDLIAAIVAPLAMVGVAVFLGATRDRSRRARRRRARRASGDARHPRRPGSPRSCGRSRRGCRSSPCSSRPPCSASRSAAPSASPHWCRRSPRS